MEDATSIATVAKDAVKHTTMHRTAPPPHTHTTQDVNQPQMSVVEIEKLD